LEPEVGLREFLACVGVDFAADARLNAAKMMAQNRGLDFESDSALRDFLHLFRGLVLR